MGWTYEVEAWTLTSTLNDKKFYGWMPVYTGESLFRAYVLMRKAKKTSGCVRLSWRS